jgi:excisionase family DNA binding protein
MTTNGRITVDEIAKRLAIGRKSVYELLEKRVLPGIRLGRRWLVTRSSYEKWEQRGGSLDPMGANVELQ